MCRSWCTQQQQADVCYLQADKAHLDDSSPSAQAGCKPIDNMLAWYHSWGPGACGLVWFKALTDVILFASGVEMTRSWGVCCRRTACRGRAALPGRCTLRRAAWWLTMAPRARWDAARFPSLRVFVQRLTTYCITSPGLSGAGAFFLVRVICTCIAPDCRLYREASHVIPYGSVFHGDQDRRLCRL